MELATQPCGMAGEQGAPRDPASKVSLQWQALGTGCDKGPVKPAGGSQTHSRPRTGKGRCSLQTEPISPRQGSPD